MSVYNNLLKQEKEIKKIRLSNDEKILIETIIGSVRNSYLEDLHAGITLSTETGDFSDVKVVSPYGEIPWTELSRISDSEMGRLKDSFRFEIMNTIKRLKHLGLSFVIEKDSPLDKFNKCHRPNEFARAVYAKKKSY